MKQKQTIGNFDLVKKINLKLVLETILQHRPLSRAQIASITGLNKMTVSSCVDFFLEKNVINELGTMGTARGRPPILLDVNRDAGICVGVDVEVNQYTVLVADLTGNKLECTTYQQINKDPRVFISSMSEIIKDLKDRYSDRSLGILGICMAMQGYYNKQSGVFGYSANLKSWIGFPIKTELQRIAPSIPCVIYAASNAGAMGEIVFGKAKDTENLVYVSGSWGLSVGIYNNGALFHGADGTAGRIGHSTIHMNGKRCSCGSRGCWEMYASVKAFYSLLNTTPEETQFQTIVDKMKENDPQVMSAIHELGHYYGIGLVNIINAYNPNTICIGGHLSFLGESFIRCIWNTLREMLPERFTQNVELYNSELGDLGVAYGAVSVILNNLSDIFIEHPYGDEH